MFVVSKLAATIRETGNNPFTLKINSYKDKTYIRFECGGMLIENLYIDQLINQGDLTPTNDFLEEYTRLAEENLLPKLKFDRPQFIPKPKLTASVFGTKPESDEYDIKNYSDMGLVCKKLYECFETYYKNKSINGAKYYDYLMKCEDITSEAALEGLPEGIPKSGLYLTEDQTKEIRAKFKKNNIALTKGTEIKPSLVAFTNEYYEKGDNAGNFNPNQKIKFSFSLQPDPKHAAYKYRTKIYDRDFPNLHGPETKGSPLKKTIDGEQLLLNPALPFNPMKISKDMNVGEEITEDTIPATNLKFGTIIHDILFQPKIELYPKGFTLVLGLNSICYSQKSRIAKVEDFSYMSSESAAAGNE